MNKLIMGWGTIILAVFIVLAEIMTWPGWTSYIWAALALIWGVMWLMGGSE